MPKPKSTHTIVIVGTEADAGDVASCLPELREYRLNDGDPIIRGDVSIYEDGKLRFVARTRPDDTLEVIEAPEPEARSGPRADRPPIDVRRGYTIRNDGDPSAEYLMPPDSTFDDALADALAEVRTILKERPGDPCPARLIYDEEGEYSGEVRSIGGGEIEVCTTGTVKVVQVDDADA